MCSFKEVLLSNKNERTINLYNVAESQKVMLSERSQTENITLTDNTYMK